MPGGNSALTRTSLASVWIPAATHEKFIKKYQLPFPLLSDADKKIVNSYGVWVEKSMYGKKYMGAERSTFVIDSAGRISAIFRKVKPEEHVAILRKALRNAAADERSLLRTPASGACVALRETGMLINIYGLPEETTKSEDLQAQAPQAHEGESPQEAFALQVVRPRAHFSLSRSACRGLVCTSLPSPLRCSK